jgi:microcystin-dependent protein
MADPFVGEIRMFGFNYVPENWQACDGSLLSIAENSALFSLLGTTYGGDGQSTFAVPDLRGRVPLHQGTGPGLSTHVIGELAGTETVTITPQQMPAHLHSVVATSSLANTGTPGNSLLPGAVSNDTMYVTDITGLTGIPSAAATVTPAGGSQPHENCMPTLTVGYCIAVNGIYPSRN